MKSNFFKIYNKKYFFEKKIRIKRHNVRSTSPRLGRYSRYEIKRFSPMRRNVSTNSALIEEFCTTDRNGHIQYTNPYYSNQYEKILDVNKSYQVNDMRQRYSIEYPPHMQPPRTTVNNNNNTSYHGHTPQQLYQYGRIN